jgi:hypothetical protein
LRWRQNAQVSAPRAASAMATFCSPVHHDPGAPTNSKMARCAACMSSRTGTPAAE